MDIDKLEGRELDALVAERIFKAGIKINRSEDEVYFHAESGLLVYPGYWFTGAVAVRSDCLTLPIHHFSTDIAAAWLVVEKLKDEFGEIEITVWGGGWGECTQVNIGDLPQVEADTAPLAICRAALKAME